MITNKIKTYNPEAKIQTAIIRRLENLGWFVQRMIGNTFQFGVPDLYASHARYGPRWIEVKLPCMKGSKWTPAQIETFPKFQRNGSPIWIITGADDSEISKLFKSSNLWEYMNKKKPRTVIDYIKTDTLPPKERKS